MNVWATGEVDLEKWNQTLKKHHSIVAVYNSIIVGFGDIDKTGFLDKLFVHKDYQRRGIASAICDKLEQSVEGDIMSNVSITAKSFFEKRGYKIIKKQYVKRSGISLTNFVMKKIK